MPGYSDRDPSGEVIVDLRGLLCPIPLIRTGEAVAERAPGDRLRLECTDPGVREDLPIWARMHGHEIEDVRTEDELIVVVLRVGPL
jgi:tRNA 2-thiouridine synthesizing protein A